MKRKSKQLFLETYSLYTHYLYAVDDKFIFLHKKVRSLNENKSLMAGYAMVGKVSDNNLI